MNETDVISQKELRQYRELADEARRATAGQEALRKSLMGRLRDGADVQPGKLAARLETSSAQRFSFDAMVQILGFKKAQEIKDQIPATPSESFKVIEVH